MGSSPILSVIHTVTIGAILNFKGGNNGLGLKNIRCKQTLKGLFICIAKVTIFLAVKNGLNAFLWY